MKEDEVIHYAKLHSYDSVVLTSFDQLQ